MSVRSGWLFENFLEGMSLGVGVFSLCHGIRDSINGKSAKLIGKLSVASFCIYMVHVFWINLFGELGVTVGLLPCIVSIPLITLFNLALSYCVYLVLSRIPVVKDWLI